MQIDVKFNMQAKLECHSFYLATKTSDLVRVKLFENPGVEETR